MDKKFTFNPNKTFLTLKNDGLELHPTFAKIFVVMVKYVTPVLILFIEVAGVLTRVVPSLGGSTNFWFVILFAALLAIISIVVYFVFFVNKETGTNADELEIDAKEKAKAEA
jgi:hypothetical protein